MSAELIHGKEVAEPILDEVTERVLALREKGWTPRLASVQIGETPAAALYVRNQRKICEKVGIEFEEIHLSPHITQREAEAALYALNMNPRITGILLQRPIPHHLNLSKLQLGIHHHKDVEGMNPANIGNAVYGNFSISPCTAVASVEALRSVLPNLRGAEAVVVGHSEIVGKPIALYLLKELVTVSVCHHGTRHLAEHTRRADVLFVAVGKPGLVTADMVKQGAIVIDIGINQVEVKNAQGEMTRKTVGDVHFDTVKEVAGWITPVPGGIGPITRAILMRNTIACVDEQLRAYERHMLPGW
jgi:methylenetetrahydrofolate dehydrogenase (NADP+)/methenyltetrahydrofolate cyclohydrolase